MNYHCAAGCDVCRKQPMPEALRAAALKLDADALEDLWRAIGDTDRAVAEGCYALALIVRRAKAAEGFEMRVHPQPLPTTPAGRLAMVNELLHPVDEDGNPTEPLISEEDARKLLDACDGEGDGHG